MDIRWDQASEDEWQARMACHAHMPLRQDWAFGEAMRRLGVKTGRAVIYDAGQAIAAAQVLQRRGLQIIGQGPIWLAEVPPARKRRALRCLARHAGATIVTPDAPLSGWGMIPLITAKASALWRIDGTTQALRQGLQAKWRNRLVKAEKTVKPMPLAVPKLQALLAQEAAQRRARGYGNLPGVMALDWSGGIVALGWHAGGALQAGMVFLRHGHCASYFLGWASPAARAAFAHGPILWQAALALRDRGVQVLDLGAVNTENGAGLAHFKLGTGASVVMAGATSLIVPG
ncbi:hypothetical protein [Pseudorhodobacter sp.]|uniref:hypothetical protein n=1 Tax=Pseudorhodobacter sp. TaxID=1934400 RepID=UPI002AFEF562|nr:hypothetical protein [Pseudorhodobacter sp.]